MINSFDSIIHSGRVSLNMSLLKKPDKCELVPKSILFNYLTSLFDFFVLILKRVQHRYKEAKIKAAQKFAKNQELRLKNLIQPQPANFS
jgi:hypothetical protein